MNKRIEQLAEQAWVYQMRIYNDNGIRTIGEREQVFSKEKFAELIIQECAGLMEQTEDDVYHCFDPAERPTEYIEWLREWQTRLYTHFGVEE